MIAADKTLPGRVQVLLPAAFWPLADQGVVSIGGFAVNLVLARYLAPADYGTFCLLFLAMLQAQVVTASLILYPLSVRGTVMDAEDRKYLFGHGLLLLLMGSIPLSIALSTALYAAHHQDLIAPVIAWLVLWQIQELLRRGLFTDMRHLSAIPGDSIRYVGQAFIVLALAVLGKLTTVNAICAMAIAAALGIAIQAPQFPIRFERPWCLRRTASDCWSIGSRSLASNLLSAMSLQMFPWLLGFTSGSASAAAYQAAGNSVTVVNPILNGLCNVIPQTVARDATRGDSLLAWRAALRYITLGAVPMLSYYALVLVLPDLILTMLYGSTSSYVALSMQTRLMAVAAIIAFGVDMANSYLHGLEEVRLSMKINALGFLAAVAIGLPLSMMLGFTGSCVAVVATNLCRALGVWLLLPSVFTRGHDERGRVDG